MEYLRLAFWALAVIFLAPFCVIAWVVLFWVTPEDDDSFDWEEETTEEYDL